MWAKWEKHFKTFGAERILFRTSMKGGKTAGRAITGATCLLFFNSDGTDKVDNLAQEISLEAMCDKLICSERHEVTEHEQENFAFQVKDTELNVFYGTKAGYAILELSPSGLPESRGKEKHRPGIILSRVFKLKKHRQWAEDGKTRITTYSFPEMKGIVYSIHLKGSHWGKRLPITVNEKPKIEAYYTNPLSFIQEESCSKCIYDFQGPGQLKSLINKFEAGTFSRWKRFRSVGFEKNEKHASKS